MSTALTRRSEAKLETRARLLEGAARVLAREGYGGLSASAVTREAGVAQPTFYVHFRDKDDLIRTLADERIGDLRARLRAAREEVRLGRGRAAVAETFRIALAQVVENPALYRLYLSERHQPGSPFGEQSRRLHDEITRDLADDLVGFGLPATTPAERERVDMLAVAIVAQTDAFALAWLEGRHRSIDAIVELLTDLTSAAIGLAT
jgi:AcrR family transcriptional regulator